MNITLKDIETISEVAEIAEGKNILNSVKAELSSQAQILLNTDQSCIEICDSWAKKNGLLFIYSIKKCGLQVDIETLKHIDPEFLSIYKFLPLKSIATSDNVILLNDPFDLSQIQEIAFVIGYKKYKIGYTNNSFLLNEITKTKTILQDVALSITNSEEASASSQNFIDIDVIDSNSESAAVYFVNNALKNAISLNASDAHFESKAEGIATRIRIDGEMRPQFHASNTIKDSIIARLKVTSGLDASETRLPQDGRIKIRISEQLIDLRVSCVPSLHGERIVIRFLGSTLAKRASTVFFRENINELFRKIARTPEGMVIITGPTGSGKTTTLYHIIDQINRSIKNVVTIEDPIEREIEKASQIQINTTHNFDFSDALKHVLRQDPDVILIGEVRDSKTASASVQAAITGHLVLTTLHAPNTRSAIPRMQDMGVKSFLVGNSIKYILSQRLVKKLCNLCKIPHEDKEFSSLGCEECEFSGFSGRVSIMEYLIIDDIIGDMISSDSTATSIWNYAKDNDLCKSMHDYGEELIKSGITTKAELEKIIGVG